MATGTVDGLPFYRVARTRPRVGTGPLVYTYTVYVEEGTIARPRDFAQEVYAILSDPRSWIKGGKVSFQQVANEGASQVILAKGATVDKLCAPLQTEGEVSCRMGSKVVINVKRWKWAVPHWTGPIRTYRQMVVNHEWGHRIGKGHGYCSGAGKPAPVMQQQTYGLQGCVENSWPLAGEIQ